MVNSSEHMVPPHRRHHILLSPLLHVCGGNPSALRHRDHGGRHRLLSLVHWRGHLLRPLRLVRRLPTCGHPTRG